MPEACRYGCTLPAAASFARDLGSRGSLFAVLRVREETGLNYMKSVKKHLRWKYLAFETEICNYYESLTSDRLKNAWGLGRACEFASDKSQNQKTTLEQRTEEIDDVALSKLSLHTPS